MKSSVLRRLPTICHLFPSISPHEAEVANSVWNLTYGVWRLFAAAADAHIEEVSKSDG